MSTKKSQSDEETVAKAAYDLELQNALQAKNIAITQEGPIEVDGNTFWKILAVNRDSEATFEVTANDRSSALAALTESVVIAAMNETVE